jgi:asparagine synthetase B (glutamine-hydrolysing)
MTASANSLPQVFGVYARNGKPCPLLKGQEKSMVFCSEKRDLVLYQSHHSSHIHRLCGRDSCLVIIGKVCRPVYLSAEVSETEERLTELLGINARDLEGHFIGLKYVKTAEGDDLLQLFTDPFGTRMFLYYESGDLLYFSSGMTGLYRLLGGRLPSVSLASLLHYYHFGFTAGDTTLCEHIRKIPAGTLLEIRNGRRSLERYFDVLDLFRQLDIPMKGEDAYAAAIDDLLDRAVRHRNPGGRPTAVSLSGGVDSGYIARKLRENGVRVVGYHLAYGDRYDEFDRVDDFSRLYAVEVIKVRAEAEALIAHMEQANGISSRPVDFNEAAMWLLAGKIKQDGFGEVWDGDGADRLFFGMNRQLLYIKTIRLYTFLKYSGFLPLFMGVLKRAKGREARKLYILFRNWQSGIPPYPERRMHPGYSEELEKSVFEMGASAYWQAFSQVRGERDIVGYFTYQSIGMCPEMFFYNPAELQLALDTMAVSAYWDKDLVRQAVHIPARLKVKRGYTKYILRKAASLNINSAANYWFLPKIGLQSARQFVIQSPRGKEWYDHLLGEVQNSSEYGLLKQALGDTVEDVDKERLVPLVLWKRQFRFHG